MQFLSDDWFEAMAAAVRTVVVPDEVTVGIGQVVMGAVGGDVRYLIDCRDGRCRLARGTVDGADVVFTSDLAVARLLAAGTGGPPGHAVLAGDVRISGDVTRLLATGDLAARLAAAIATIPSLELGGENPPKRE